MPTVKQAYILLMDADGEGRLFAADDLPIQLLSAGVATGADAVKAAARQFAATVHAMRREQRAGSDRAKELEKKTDALVLVFNQTLEKL